jgi:hypothetical protein
MAEDSIKSKTNSNKFLCFSGFCGVPLLPHHQKNPLQDEGDKKPARQKSSGLLIFQVL